MLHYFSSEIPRLFIRGLKLFTVFSGAQARQSKLFCDGTTRIVMCCEKKKKFLKKSLQTDPENTSYIILLKTCACSSIG